MLTADRTLKYLQMSGAWVRRGKLGRNFSVAHAVYAAAFLSVCTNNIDTAGLGFLNYFEPVNEGAIFSPAAAQGAFGTSSLTPVGKVIKLYTRHAGGELLEINSSSDDDINIVATLHRPSASATKPVVTVTVVNLNAISRRTVHAALKLPADFPSRPTRAATIEEEATGYDRSSVFKKVYGYITL